MALHFSFLLPLIFSILAFITALLVLLGGNSPTTFPNIYLLKIDTSTIQPSNLNLNSLPVDIPNQITDIVDDLPDALIDQVANTAAEQLGLKDFYTAHVMTYCEGTLLDKLSPPEEQVTKCSKPSLSRAFNFDPIDIFEQQLIPGITIDDLGVPAEADTAIEALAITYKVMFITYIVGAALAGFSVLLSLLVLVWAEKRIFAFFLGLVAFLSFVSLGVASGIATALATKVKDIFNEYMVENLNVRASSSSLFLGLTWASVAGMLMVVLYSFWGCCCRPRGERKSRESVEYEEKPVSRWGRRRRGGGTV